MPVLGTGVAGLIRKSHITFSLWFTVGMVCHGIPWRKGTGPCRTCWGHEATEGALCTRAELIPMMAFS